MTFDALRAWIPVCREYAYFQTGTYGPKPEPVIAEVERWLRFQNRGPALPEVNAAVHEMFEQVRAKVAAALGAEPGEIALTENTTVGLDIVANGIDWRPGDNVILSDQEHPANRIPWYNVAERYGVEVRIVKAGADVERFLADLERLLDGRTRVVSLSHVSRETGLRYPIPEVAELVHRHGVPLLVDGAQAFGAIPVNVKTLGCDYYAFSGHKYILGPQGTGGFYVRQEMLDSLRPVWVGAGSGGPDPDRPGQMRWTEGAKRFEFGTRALAYFAGFGKALDLWQELGWPEVHGRMAAYAAQVKARLSAIPGLVLDTPWDAAQSAGIVTFRVPGHPAQEIYTSLLEKDKVLTVPNGMPEQGVRVSVHVFNNQEDLERLVEGVRRAVAEPVAARS